MATAKLHAFFKDWVAPGAGAFILCLMAWLRMEYTLVEHEKAIQTIRTEQSRMRTAGPDGFLDPSVRCLHDSHAFRWHELQFGRAGWRKILTEYSTNGGAK